MTEPVTIDRVSSELYKAFDLFNQKYFENKLPITAITIQSSGHKRNSMGWCTTNEVWGNKEGNIKMYEINLSAEFLDLDFHETMDTLLHEMVHLFHMVKGIKDTSRKGTYHNKNFRNKVLEIGFEYKDDKPDSLHGWSFARIGEKVKNEIDEMDINKDVFSISRKGFSYFQQLDNGSSPDEVEIESTRGTAVSNPSSFKWFCEGCRLIMRSSKKEVNVICGDCNKTLIKSE
ncbi:SprT-like domain-containing protein [Oceanobacillus sp. FSL K6-0251]|uniref:SprT-like domain-containing protein n=1 Tax=Oceanobacillus sp. FSL K6-0251 TaxID=2921602 RepID=UPI0030F55841